MGATRQSPAGLFLASPRTHLCWDLRCAVRHRLMRGYSSVKAYPLPHPLCEARVADPAQSHPPRVQGGAGKWDAGEYSVGAGAGGDEGV